MTCKAATDDTLGLRMQGRLYLLVTKLIERIGLVRRELMTELREKRFGLVWFTEGGIGPPQ